MLKAGAHPCPSKCRQAHGLVPRPLLAPCRRLAQAQARSAVFEGAAANQGASTRCATRSGAASHCTAQGPRRAMPSLASLAEAEDKPLSALHCGAAAATALAFLLLHANGATAMEVASLGSALTAGAADPSALAESAQEFEAGFASSFLLVLFSEIGDKTFFIAALLAARQPALQVFTGTFGALGVMTLVTVVLGRGFHVLDELAPIRLGDAVLPIDDICAAILLVYFGVSTLRDALLMDDAEALNEEEEEAAKALEGFPFGSSSGSSAGGEPSPSGRGASGDQGEHGASPPGGIASTNPASTPASLVASVFTLVFVAEWGDKSFFSTMALAAASSPLGVIAGSLTAHAGATLIAVLGGAILSQYISEKFVALVGGILFMAFAAGTIFEIVDKVSV